jgi:Fe-S oxidoreductase
MSHSAPISFVENSSGKMHAHLDHDLLMDCIHCGLCLSQCPTYAELGQEADSPRGRIYLVRALAEGRAEPTPDLVKHLDLCLGCRACETACPSGVQYGHIIEGARSYLRENYDRPSSQQTIGKIIETTFPHPHRLEAALLPIRVLRRTGVLPFLHKTGFMKLLGPLGDMERMLPKLPPMQKRLKFPTTWRARGEEQAHVAMITGCVMQVMQSDVNVSTARVLTKAGCRVEAPKSQVCCGALHAHVGGMEEAKEFARKNIEAFEKVERETGPLDAIIINAAGCGAALKEYAGWFKGDPAWASRASAFCVKVRDVSEFLAEPEYKARLESLMEHKKADAELTNTGPASKMRDVPRETIPNTAGAASLNGDGRRIAHRDSNQQEALDTDEATRPPETDAPRNQSIGSHGSRCGTCTMTYHDACHLAHGQGIRTQPRELMEALPGSSMVPLQESEMCCGSAGIYNITQPKMAMDLLERKMRHIAATGASVVVTGNPGCMMQLMLGAKKFDVEVEIKHPVEMLDAATKSHR